MLLAFSLPSGLDVGEPLLCRQQDAGTTGVGERVGADRVQRKVAHFTMDILAVFSFQNGARAKETEMLPS